MRYHEILLELDLSKTLNNFGDKLMQRAQQERGAIRDAISNEDGPVAQHILSFLLDRDPTSKKAFVLHLIRWYLDGSMQRLEDASKATDACTLYAKFRNRGLAPLNQMSFSQFLDLGEELSDMRSQTEMGRDEEQGYYDRGEAALLTDTAEFKVIEPQTEGAAKFFGRNTRWCTASENNNMFQDYFDDGPIYIIAFKGQGAKKWQFHFESDQFMDERDDPLEEQEIRDEPAICDIFKEDFIAWGKLEYVRNPDDMGEDRKTEIIELFGPNIQYFKKPDLALVLLALHDDRTTWSMIPDEFHDITDVQIASIKRRLDRFSAIENPLPETIYYFERTLSNRLRDFNDEELRRFINRKPDWMLQYIADHKIGEDEYFAHLANSRLKHLEVIRRS